MEERDKGQEWWNLPPHFNRIWSPNSHIKQLISALLVAADIDGKVCVVREMCFHLSYFA